MADQSTSEPLTSDHIFRVASHSKTFTATAIMQLKELGQLQLDDSVRKYLPWFSSKADSRVEKITIRELLGHTSGLIRDGTDVDYWGLEREFPTEKELTDSVQEFYVSRLGVLLDQ